MSRVATIAHTCIGVSDLGRAMSFYQDGLGLTVRGRTEMPNGTVLVLLGCPSGDEVIELYWTPGLTSPVGAGGPAAVPSPGAGHRHVAFWVDDVRKTVAELQTLGWAVTRRPPEPGQPGSLIAFVKDPDGADIELMQR